MSKIEWTGKTWNPVTGCTRASAGCDNCYAVTMTHRLAGMGQEKKYGGLTVLNPKGDRHFNGVVRCHDDALDIPLKVKKPTTWFVNSMSDLFHKDVPFEFIDKVFAVMALCPQHTFQILTKRPERMAEYLNVEVPDRWCSVAFRVSQMCTSLHGSNPSGIYLNDEGWPLPNVWLGTSCENQETANERIPHLLTCPAAVRFLSCEPLLGAIDLNRVAIPNGFVEINGGTLPPINWVIVGGESGRKARPCNIEWIRSIVQQCKAKDAACFMKQLGAKPFDGTRSDIYFDDKLRYKNVPDDGEDAAHARQCLGSELVPARIKLNSPKGGSMEEWPADLRVRQMP